MRCSMIHEISHITVDVEKQKKERAKIQELTKRIELYEMIIGLLYSKIKAEETKEDK